MAPSVDDDAAAAAAVVDDDHELRVAPLAVVRRECGRRRPPLGGWALVFLSLLAVPGSAVAAARGGGGDSRSVGLLSEAAELPGAPCSLPHRQSGLLDSPPGYLARVPCAEPPGHRRHDRSRQRSVVGGEAGIGDGTRDRGDEDAEDVGGPAAAAAAAAAGGTGELECFKCVPREHAIGDINSLGDENEDGRERERGSDEPSGRLRGAGRKRGRKRESGAGAEIGDRPDAAGGDAVGAELVADPRGGSSTKLNGGGGGAGGSLAASVAAAVFGAVLAGAASSSVSAGGEEEGDGEAHGTERVLLLPDEDAVSPGGRGRGAPGGVSAAEVGGPDGTPLESQGARVGGGRNGAMRSPASPDAAKGAHVDRSRRQAVGFTTGGRVAGGSADDGNGAALGAEFSSAGRRDHELTGPAERALQESTTGPTSAPAQPPSPSPIAEEASPDAPEPTPASEPTPVSEPTPASPPTPGPVDEDVEPPAPTPTPATPPVVTVPDPSPPTPIPTPASVDTPPTPAPRAPTPPTPPPTTPDLPEPTFQPVPISPSPETPEPSTPAADVPPPPTPGPATVAPEDTAPQQTPAPATLPVTELDTPAPVTPTTTTPALPTATTPTPVTTTTTPVTPPASSTLPESTPAPAAAPTATSVPSGGGGGGTTIGPASTAQPAAPTIGSSTLPPSSTVPPGAPSETPAPSLDGGGSTSQPGTTETISPSASSLLPDGVTSAPGSTSPPSPVTQTTPPGSTSPPSAASSSVPSATIPPLADDDPTLPPAVTPPQPGSPPPTAVLPPTYATSQPLAGGAAFPPSMSSSPVVSAPPTVLSPTSTAAATSAPLLPSPGSTSPPSALSQTLPAATLPPLAGGATHSPSTTLSPVTTPPAISPTAATVATLSPLGGGATYPPGTTLSPVNTPSTISPSAATVATLPPLAGGATHSPSTTVSPVNTPPAISPTVATVATLPPLAGSATYSPGTTLPPVNTSPTIPPSAATVATLPPLAGGATHSPSTTVSPLNTPPAISPTVATVTTLPPLAGGATYSPGTTVPPVNTPPTTPPTVTTPATFSPLPEGTTRSPSTTLSPVNPTPTISPPVTAATFPPLPEGSTHSPSITLSPVTTPPPLPPSAAAADTPAPLRLPSPGGTPSPAALVATYPPVVEGKTLSPSITLAPVSSGAGTVVDGTRSPSSSSEPGATPIPLTVSPANAYLPPGTTLAPDETLPPGATLAPVVPTPQPTKQPTNATVEEEILDTTGDTASGAVVVAVAATGAAATVSSVTATTAAAAAAGGATGAGAAASGTAVAAAAGGGAAPSAAAAATGGGVAGATGGGVAGTAGGTVAGATTTTGATTVVGSSATATAAVDSTAVAATTTATSTTTTGTTGGATSGATSGATTTTGGGTTTGTGGTGGGGGGASGPDSTGLRQGPNANMASNQPGASGAGGETTTTLTQEKGAVTANVDPGTVSSRSPSATLGLLMIFQIQFLSSLRLLEANISAPFLGMLNQLKWLNMHFDIDLGFASCGNEDSTFTWAENDNGSWAFNTFAVFGILAMLVVCHILLLSYMEASWLATANAIHRTWVDRVRERSSRHVGSVPEVPEAHAKYLDEDKRDRDLDEQEARATERFLRRHNSVWMYFPHVELVFLLFAYQGASTAEARMIRSGCLPLVVLGACALFVFPIIMIFYVGRIVWSRVKPTEGPVTFEKSLTARGRRGEDVERATRKRCWCINVCRGFRDGWRHGQSVFEWADKGAWRCREDEKVDFEGRKFRIGFEPLFVDFTQKGAVYVTFLLFKWFALGIVAGLVTNGTVQTASLAAIYLVDIVLLCVLQPFSNSVVQWVETVLVTVDAATLGLMVWASILDPDDNGDQNTLDAIYAGCMLIQTLGILMLTIPIYADTFIVLFFQVRVQASKLMSRGKPGEPKQEVEEKAQKHDDIKGSCGETCAIFCALVRENFIGCAKASVYGPRSQKNARSSFQQEIARMESRRLASIREEEKEPSRRTFVVRNPVKPRQLPKIRHGRSMSGDLETGESNRAMLVERSPTAASSASSRARKTTPADRHRNGAAALSAEGEGDTYDHPRVAPEPPSSSSSSVRRRPYLPSFEEVVPAPQERGRGVGDAEGGRRSTRRGRLGSGGDASRRTSSMTPRSNQLEPVALPPAVPGGRVERQRRASREGSRGGGGGGSGGGGYRNSGSSGARTPIADGHAFAISESPSWGRGTPSRNSTPESGFSAAASTDRLWVHTPSHEQRQPQRQRHELQQQRWAPSDGGGSVDSGSFSAYDEPQYPRQSEYSYEDSPGGRHLRGFTKRR